MVLDIDTWMQAHLEKLKSQFGARLQFVGLQGSYGRGEATENSDIDAVVILDRVEPADLQAYSALLDTLPHREQACGFISGRQELINWERSDLFQFYYDTTPLFGSIDFVLPQITQEDIRRAVRIGACNLYHACGHNIVHEKDVQTLIGLYKTAAFTIQAVNTLQTGTYVRHKAELIPLLAPQEREILQTGVRLKQQPQLAKNEFDRFSALLFIWAARLIAEYKAE